MSSEVTTDVIRVSGLAKVDATLASLGSADGTRVLRRSMLMAGEPILKAAQRNVAGIEHGSGALHKSLGLRFLYGRNKRAAAFMPPMGGKFRVQVVPFAKNRVAIALYNLYYRVQAKRLSYAHLLEFGYVHTGGKKIAKQPFLRPALEQEKHNALRIFAHEMEVGIAKMLKKQARVAAKAAKQ